MPQGGILSHYLAYASWRHIEPFGVISSYLTPPYISPSSVSSSVNPFLHSKLSHLTTRLNALYDPNLTSFPPIACDNRHSMMLLAQYDELYSISENTRLLVSPFNITMGISCGDLELLKISECYLCNCNRTTSNLYPVLFRVCAHERFSIFRSTDGSSSQK